MIKTVKVKLHNPSNRKQAILDKVFLRWTLAADVTLRWAQEHLGAFEDCQGQRGNYRGNLIAGVLSEHVRDRIKRFGLHSSMEHALWRDIGAMLASYFERQKRNPNTGFPTVYRVKTNATRYEAALDALAALTDENEAADGHRPSVTDLHSELMSAAWALDFHVRPIYFGTTDAVPNRRGYSILYDEAKDRYLALLYLLPGSASNRQRRPLTVHKPLLALNKHEEYLRETGRASGALLFPLEMGSWQKETFFDPARDDPGAIRTAYLIRETNEQGEVDYYLSIAVDLPTAEPIEVINALGIHHTLEGEVFASVMDPDGEALYYEQVVGPLQLKDALQQRQAWLRRGKPTPHRIAGERIEHHYHAAANRIVDLAKEHCAQVGVEDLSYLRTKTGRKAIDRKLFRAPISRLTDFLRYKLPFAGLPSPLKVGGVSPRECHRCGKTSREKTVRTEGRISCPLCSLDMDVHENNARLVAVQVPEIVERIEAARQRRRQGEKERGSTGDGEAG